MTQATDTPELILQEVLKDEAFIFRVHNIKPTLLSIKQDLPQMFLAHYDSLDAELKADMPLSAELLRKINLMMRADEANALLGLPAGTIRPAYHIKISGTVVIVNDELPLALHLTFTNTAKSSQVIYGTDPSVMIGTEANKWQMAGLVNILHKSTKFTLLSQDLSDDVMSIEPAAGYLQLPNAHALATTHAINTIKSDSPERLQHLHDAIVETVLATYQYQAQ